jgi:gas vesicle protein
MYNSQTAKFFKGVTTGLIIGAAITMLTDPITDRQRNKLMRKTEGVFKSMGEMIDSAISMFH